MTSTGQLQSPATRSTDHLPATLWKFFLLLVWAGWWGGLSFYAIVVVPIGTEIFGSVEQGFLTQRVTQYHNAVAAIFVVCLLVEACRRRSRLLWIATFILAITVVSLVVWHIHLTSQMDFHEKTVPRHFYSEHAIYLWITAVEWFVGLAVPVPLFATRGNASVD